MEPTDKDINALVIESGGALTREKAREVLISRAHEAAANEAAAEEAKDSTKPAADGGKKKK